MDVQATPCAPVEMDQVDQGSGIVNQGSHKRVWGELGGRGCYLGPNDGGEILNSSAPAGARTWPSLLWTYPERLTLRLCLSEALPGSFVLAEGDCGTSSRPASVENVRRKSVGGPSRRHPLVPTSTPYPTGTRGYAPSPSGPLPGVVGCPGQWSISPGSWSCPQPAGTPAGSTQLAPWGTRSVHFFFHQLWPGSRSFSLYRCRRELLGNR